MSIFTRMDKTVGELPDTSPFIYRMRAKLGKTKIVGGVREVYVRGNDVVYEVMPDGTDPILSGIELRASDGWRFEVID